MTLTSLEVVMLDTLVIRDVLGLQTHSGDAGQTRVLPGTVSGCSFRATERRPGGFMTSPW